MRVLDNGLLRVGLILPTESNIATQKKASRKCKKKGGAKVRAMGWG